MKIKEKAKKFWKENGRDIVFYTTGLVVGGVVWYNVGKQTSIPWDKETRKRIGDILSYGQKGNKYSVFTGVGPEITLKVEQLGELGKKMIETGTPEEHIYNRFIVIGDPYN